MQRYLKLPIRFRYILDKETLPTCTINNSINYNLHLLITTVMGENKQDPNYGSAIWETDFDIHLSAERRKEAITNNLARAIALYERRLDNVAVNVNVKQVECVFASGRQIKRRVEIIISGNIARSNEDYRFQTGFYVGPLVFD